MLRTTFSSTFPVSWKSLPPVLGICSNHLLSARSDESGRRNRKTRDLVTGLMLRNIYSRSVICKVLRTLLSKSHRASYIRKFRVFEFLTEFQNLLESFVLSSFIIDDDKHHSWKKQLFFDRRSNLERTDNSSLTTNESLRKNEVKQRRSKYRRCCFSVKTKCFHEAMVVRDVFGTLQQQDVMYLRDRSIHFCYTTTNW